MAKAKYYVMTGEGLTGKEAERIGLVSAAVTHPDVLTVTMDLAEPMATGPQHALRWTKRSLNHWLRMATPAFEASLAFEGLTFFSPDFIEAITAMSENRAPSFSRSSVW